MSKINYRKDKPSENKNQCRYCKALFLSEDDRINHEKLQFPANGWVPGSSKSYVDFDALTKHVRKYDVKHGTNLLNKLMAEHTRRAPCSACELETLATTIESLTRAALETQERLDKYAKQQKEELAKQQQLEIRRTDYVQQYAEKLTEITGNQYRLVKIDDNFEMEHAWNIQEVFDFFAAHGIVFMTNTFTATKMMKVVSLFPVDEKVTHLVTDHVLANVVQTVVKHVRESKTSVFNMMSLLRHQSTLYTPVMYIGHFVASQKCYHGCQFCQTIFEFDAQKHVYANDVCETQQPNKYRKVSDNENDDLPIQSSSSSELARKCNNK